MIIASADFAVSLSTVTIHGPQKLCDEFGNFPVGCHGPNFQWNSKIMVENRPFCQNSKSKIEIIEKSQ